MLTIPVDGAPHLGEGVEMWATPSNLWLLRNNTRAVALQGSFAPEVVALASGEAPPPRFWTALWAKAKPISIPSATPPSR